MVKDQEVVEAFRRKRFKGQVDTNTSFQGYSSVYREGVEDGKRFSIFDKVTGGSSRERLSLPV